MVPVEGLCVRAGTAAEQERTSWSQDATFSVKRRKDGSLDSPLPA